MKVIYGDTDSAFIQVEKKQAQIVVDRINRHITPYEVEAGEFYKSMLFTGVKKRYAGLTEDDELVVKGFEVNKRDYCALARDTQENVLKMILMGATYQQVADLFDNLLKRILKGEFDQLLIVTKGVKDIEEYNFKKRADGTEHAGQPHIRAYKKLLERGFGKQYDISFFYTLNDVIPYVEGDPIPTNIDYEKYWRTQFVSPNQSIVKAAFKGKALPNYPHEKFDRQQMQLFSN